MRVNSQRMMASTKAEMNVPAKAKVKIVPMLRKKLPCAEVVSHMLCLVASLPSETYLMQFISTSQDDRRQQQVEEELIVEADQLQHARNCCESQHQPNYHTRKDRYDRLMHRLNLPTLQHIASEERRDQQAYKDEQRP